MQKTRHLPTWQIGGAAWKRNAKFLETGQWVNPTWTTSDSDEALCSRKNECDCDTLSYKLCDILLT